jgi:hypothetical protein
MSMPTFPTRRLAIQFAADKAELTGRVQVVLPYLNTGRYLTMPQVEWAMEVHDPEYTINSVSCTVYFDDNGELVVKE